MIPLHPVALGLVIIALVVDGSGWDLLPDPVGWALVLWGTTALPASLRHRRSLTTTATLALAAACLLWVPGTAESVADVDESLSWALSLPQLAYLVLLSDALRYAARQAGHPGRAAWFAAAELSAVAATVLPVLVFGGGLEVLAGTAVLAASLTLLLLVALTLASARAPWAGGRPRTLPGLPSPAPDGPTPGPDRDSPTKTREDS